MYLYVCDILLRWLERLIRSWLKQIQYQNGQKPPHLWDAALRLLEVLQRHRVAVLEVLQQPGLRLGCAQLLLQIHHAALQVPDAGGAGRLDPRLQNLGGLDRGQLQDVAVCILIGLLLLGLFVTWRETFIIVRIQFNTVLLHRL